MNINAQIAAALTDVADGYIERTARPPKKGKRILLAVIAAAACLALVVGAIPIVALIRGKGPDVNSSETAQSGTQTKPPILSYPNARYDADTVAGLFGNSYGGTSSYKEIEVPDPEMLFLPPLREQDCLPVYDRYIQGPEYSKDEFEAFTDRVLPKMAEALGVDWSGYQIEESTALFTEQTTFKAQIEQGEYSLGTFGQPFHHAAHINSHPESGEPYEIRLGGQPVTVDPSLSDEQIISSLADVRTLLLEMFGRDFPDARVVLRDYYDNGGGPGVTVRVSFYDESAHELNQYMEGPISDEIYLEFNGRFDGSRLGCSQIWYFEDRMDVNESCRVKSYERMLSLSEAEDLLEAGYVFGGHSCPKCMSKQEKVDFSDYDYVGLTYVEGVRDLIRSPDQPTPVFPFYVFYKKLDKTTENGLQIYARTYVPAVEVSGLKEYFKAQEKNHPGWEED